MKAAVLGTNDYHAVMQQVAKNALQRQGGYVPGHVEIDATTPPKHRGYLYPIRAVLEIADVWKWCNGRGWICGSAALYEYSRSRDDSGTIWHYGDIDVFAHSDEAYRSLVADATEGNFTDEHEAKYSFKSEYVRLPCDSVISSLNIVRPSNGTSWENPFHVWESFDLNVAQCVIVSPEWVSVTGSVALVKWDFSDEDNRPFLEATLNLRSAARFAERVQKYVRRGFRVSGGFWADVLNIAEHLGETRYAEYCSLIRFLDAIGDEKSRLAMQVGVDDLTDYLDGVTVDSHEYDDDYDDPDRYWHS